MIFILKKLEEKEWVLVWDGQKELCRADSRSTALSRSSVSWLKAGGLEEKKHSVNQLRCSVTSVSGSCSAHSEGCQQYTVYFPICFCLTCSWKLWVIHHNLLWHWVAGCGRIEVYVRVKNTREASSTRGGGSMEWKLKKTAFLVINGYRIHCCAHPRLDPPSAGVSAGHCLLYKSNLVLNL